MTPFPPGAVRLATGLSLLPLGADCGLSVWLLPAEPLRSQLRQTIARVAAQHKLSPFEPHVTLLSMPDTDSSASGIVRLPPRHARARREAMAQAAALKLQDLVGSGTLPPTLPLRFSSLAMEPAWNQLAVLVADETPALGGLAGTLRRSLLPDEELASAAHRDVWAPPLLKPHLSLAYGVPGNHAGNSEVALSETISEVMDGMGLALPLDFDADEIALVDCTPASIRGVPQWREVKRVTLRPPGGAGEAAAAVTAVVAATMSASAGSALRGRGSAVGGAQIDVVQPDGNAAGTAPRPGAVPWSDPRLPGGERTVGTHFVEEAELQAIIFDLDGTLLNSMPSFFTPLYEAVAAVGLELGEREFYEAAGQPLPQLIRSLHRSQLGTDAPSALVDQFVAMVRMHDAAQLLREFPPPIDCVVQIAVDAAARGIKVAVATSSPRDRVDAFIKKAGLSTIFNRHKNNVVTAGELPTDRGKPHPAIFLEAARRVRAEPRFCRVYEDSEAGLQAAWRGGMHVIDVTYMDGYPTHPGLQLAKAWQESERSWVHEEPWKVWFDAWLVSVEEWWAAPGHRNKGAEECLAAMGLSLSSRLEWALQQWRARTGVGITPGPPPATRMQNDPPCEWVPTESGATLPDKDAELPEFPPFPERFQLPSPLPPLLPRELIPRWREAAWVAAWRARDTAKARSAGGPLAQRHTPRNAVAFGAGIGVLGGLLCLGPAAAWHPLGFRRPPSPRTGSIRSGPKVPVTTLGHLGDPPLVLA